MVKFYHFDVDEHIVKLHNPPVSSSTAEPLPVLYIHSEDSALERDGALSQSISLPSASKLSCYVRHSSVLFCSFLEGLQQKREHLGLSSESCHNFSFGVYVFI